MILLGWRRGVAQKRKKGGEESTQARRRDWKRWQRLKGEEKAREKRQGRKKVLARGELTSNWWREGAMTTTFVEPEKRRRETMFPRLKKNKGTLVEEKKYKVTWGGGKRKQEVVNLRARRVEKRV